MIKSKFTYFYIFFVTYILILSNDIVTISDNYILNTFKYEEILPHIYVTSVYNDYKNNKIILILLNLSKQQVVVENIHCEIHNTYKHSTCKIDIISGVVNSDNHLFMGKVEINKAVKYLLINGIVFKIKRKEKMKYNITLCITEFINIKSTLHLLQAFESYITLGIDHIIIYMTSCSYDVEKILNYYKKIGIITIIKCDYSFENKYLLYLLFGQLWKINDCLYRMKYSTKLLLINDIDEIVWPVNKHNILLSLNDIDEMKSDFYYIQQRMFMIGYSNIYDRFVFNNSDYNMFHHTNSCVLPLKRTNKYIIKNLRDVIYITVHRLGLSYKKLLCKFVNYSHFYIRHTRVMMNYHISSCIKWINSTTLNEKEVINKVIKKVNQTYELIFTS